MEDVRAPAPPSSGEPAPHNAVKGAAPVSVVIPCYRCATTIERAVASVAAQTTQPSEVILIDDCSPDHTLQTLHELAGRYPPGWVKVLSQPVNRGPSAARNRGWDMATGDYVAFLDSDDSWHPEKTCRQLAVMEADPTLVLSGTTWKIDNDSDELDLRDTDLSEVKPKTLLFSNKFCTSGVMVRRDIEFRFDEKKRRSEDYLLWLTLSLKGFKILQLKAPLAFYYKAPFGEAGLSENIWEMQLAQLDTYRRLRDRRLIGPLTFQTVRIWSCLRFSRRFVAFMKQRSRSRNENLRSAESAPAKIGLSNSRSASSDE